MIFKLSSNDSKTVILMLVKEEPCSCERGWIADDKKKSWKTMENTSIKLYCIDFFLLQ